MTLFPQTPVTMYFRTKSYIFAPLFFFFLLSSDFESLGGLGLFQQNKTEQNGMEWALASEQGTGIDGMDE